MGRFRERYRVLDPDEAELRKNDKTVRYNEGLPVDTSYRLADGRDFTDIRSFKKLLAEDAGAIARTLVDRLVVYSTGAITTMADRREVERIVAATAEADHGVRSIIHAVVQSNLFRSR